MPFDDDVQRVPGIAVVEDDLVALEPTASRPSRELGRLLFVEEVEQSPSHAAIEHQAAQKPRAAAPMSREE